MTESDYIKHLLRVATSVTRAHGGEAELRGRRCHVYWPTRRGHIVGSVWLGRLDESGFLRPTAVVVTGPSVTGTFDEIEDIMLNYRSAVTVLQRIVNRLTEDAVECPDDEIEELDEDDIITEDEDDE